MSKESRLPHNKKEGLVYGSIICILTVTFMVLLNTYLNKGKITFGDDPNILKIFSILFIIAMLLENLVINHFTTKMTALFVSSKDSFNAKILFTILFTVIGMSFFMTFIATYVSSGFDLSSISFNYFISNWPRNFSIVFAFELLFAQPIARKAMIMLHKN